MCMIMIYEGLEMIYVIVFSSIQVSVELLRTLCAHPPHAFFCLNFIIRGEHKVLYSTPRGVGCRTLRRVTTCHGNLLDFPEYLRRRRCCIRVLVVRMTGIIEDYQGSASASTRSLAIYDLKGRHQCQ